jgi:hypothetical protein
MYHKHTTHAFVLDVSTSGEKNHFVTLFTREFGMIKAKAQSVRVMDSKLRYALQEYSYIEVSLVKGKDIWRITNALPIYNFYFELMSLRAVIPAPVFTSINSGGIKSENADLDPREYPRMTHGEEELDVKIYEEKENVFIVIARILSLLCRLVPEEGCEALIFDDMEAICENALAKKYTKKSIKTLEWLFILRMLCFLGYSHKEAFVGLCDDKIEWNNEYLESVSSYKEKAIYSINNALKASQL